jgi:hypothetical protein
MSFIGWLDHSEAEQRQIRELLQMFTDKGTVDDLGIGTVRDAISNRLFPGTSVTQTRARYFLFIPWIFLRAESKHPTQILDRSDAMERRLIGSLLEAEDQDGLIGRQVGKDIRMLPSALYWSGLSSYGIFLQPGLTRAQYSRSARTAPSTQFEEELAERSNSFWHRGIPAAPDGFFDFAGADFALTKDEASWLSERVLSTEPLRGPNLLGGYVRDLQSAPPNLAESFWKGPLPQDTPDDLKSMVYHAERFSAAVESSAIMYNLMLHEKRNDVDRGDDQQVDLLRERLDERAEMAQSSNLADWANDLTPFWALITSRSRVPALTRSFIDQWCVLLAQQQLKPLADNPAARSLIRNREIQHKKAQARFANPARLSDWNGQSGLAPLEFRWSQVTRFLTDLSTGLHGSSDLAEETISASN